MQVRTVIQTGSALPGISATLDAGLSTPVETLAAPAPIDALAEVTPVIPSLESVEEEESMEPSPTLADATAGELPVIETYLPKTFAVSVRKGASKLGIDVKYSEDNALVITGVQVGPVADFNKAKPDEELVVGDRIVGIDGLRDAKASELLDKLRVAGETVELSVDRPSEILFYVTDGGSEGGGAAIVTTISDIQSLIVVNIPDDLVLHQSTDQEKLVLGDRIVAVNGVRSDANRMTEELRSAKLPVGIAVRRVPNRAQA